MIVKNCMKRDVLSVAADSTVRDAAAIFVKHHIGLLPILDEDDKPIGEVGLQDLLTLEMPDFVSFVKDVDFVHDFGAVETTRPPAHALDQSIKKLMKPAVTVPVDCGLLRAYSLMLQNNLHDILVVTKAGKLAGIVSRVDVGVAILKAWKKDKGS